MADDGVEHARLHPGFDEDAFYAALDLIGRSGCTQFELSWDDDVDPWTWTASARYKGARLIGDTIAEPVAAVEALVRKVLAGGQCQGCGRTVSLTDTPGTCRWTRMGREWTRACGPLSGKPGGPNRAQRRWNARRKKG